MEEHEEIEDEEQASSYGSSGEDDFNEDEIEIVACDDEGKELVDDDSPQPKGAEAELDEARGDYVRLYAEFENYKKRVIKDKEEMAKFANESMIMDILPSLDHLEIALKHARENEDEDSPKSGLMQGVDMTLRELLRTLEKFGIMQIEAKEKPFDPEFHHAVAQVHRDDMDAGMVVEELRKGYVYNGKVIRATMVSVSTDKSPEVDADGANSD